MLKEHSSSIRAVAFSPTNENILVICSRVGSCIVYDATEVGDYKQVQVMQDHTGEVNVATFSPTGGNMLVTCSEDDSCIVYDGDGATAGEFKQVQQLQDHGPMLIRRRSRRSMGLSW